MRYLLFAFLIITVLSGCKNSMKEARAAEARAETRRRNDIHNAKMADTKSLTPVRLATKETLYWSLMVGGSVVIIGGSTALTWLMIGASFNFVRHQRIKQIPLDVATRQFPLLIYGNGRRAFNPNNGERVLLTEKSEAHQPRIEASTQVQLAGLIADSSKIINGVTNENL